MPLVVQGKFHDKYDSFSDIIYRETGYSVATSAVAASLLLKGRTAHSGFKIAIPCFEDSVCSIPTDSKLAQEIKDSA